MNGYHLNTIPKGEFGEFSKIEEEFLELKDAYHQDAKIMMLVELSDLIGAIQAYLSRYHPTLSINDILRMTSITRRAFESGERK